MGLFEETGVPVVTGGFYQALWLTQQSGSRPLDSVWGNLDTRSCRERCRLQKVRLVPVHLGAKPAEWTAAPGEDQTTSMFQDINSLPANDRMDIDARDPSDQHRYGQHQPWSYRVSRVMKHTNEGGDHHW